MAYDLLIRNGLIVDGSGMPAFRGDVGVKDGKIAEIGKLTSPAEKTVDVEGRAVAPGFIDNHCHYDPQGVHIPALWADEKEIFALGDVLREMATGTIQAGGGQYVELKDGMIRRLAEATGRTVVYNSLSQTMRKPDEWKVHMKRVEERKGRENREERN